jgi:hypothetical protein
MVTPLPIKTTFAVSFNGKTVGGVTNMRLTNGPSLVDITSIGDDYVARYPTIADWSITMDLVYDATDEGQAKLIAALYTPADEVLIITLPGPAYLTGTGFVESFDYTFDPKEVLRASVSIKGNSLLALT